jgi:hypothetical protein
MRRGHSRLDCLSGISEARRRRAEPASTLVSTLVSTTDAMDSRPQRDSRLAAGGLTAIVLCQHDPEIVVCEAQVRENGSWQGLLEETQAAQVIDARRLTACR